MFRLIGGLGGKLQRDDGKQIGITNRMVHRSSFRWELRGFYGKEGRLKTQTAVFRRPLTFTTTATVSCLSGAGRIDCRI